MARLRRCLWSRSPGCLAHHRLASRAAFKVGAQAEPSLCAISHDPPPYRIARAPMRHIKNCSSPRDPFAAEASCGRVSMRTAQGSEANVKDR